jgi:hypothetical protein
MRAGVRVVKKVVNQDVRVAAARLEADFNDRFDQGELHIEALEDEMLNAFSLIGEVPHHAKQTLAEEWPDSNRRI